jgi:hypothetical protein
VPCSRANIDHVVIGPVGVYVVDAKRYKNAKVAIRRTGGLFSPVREQLSLAGRDKTKLACCTRPACPASCGASAGQEQPVAGRVC